MFDLREFILKGLLGAVGRMEDYLIILNAAGWHKKGVLSEEDLSCVNEAVTAQYTEEVTEE